MSRETEIEELAALVLDAINRRDPDALIALAHPEYEFRSQLVRVEGTVYTGPTGFHTWLHDLGETFMELSWELEEIIDAPGDDFVLVVRFTAVGRESGVPFDGLTFQVWTLRDGKPFSNIVYASKADAFEAVGLSG